VASPAGWLWRRQPARRRPGGDRAGTRQDPTGPAGRGRTFVPLW